MRQRDLAQAKLGLGVTSLERRDYQRALAQAAAVERTLERLVRAPGDLDAARIVAEARLLGGDVPSGQGAARRCRGAAPPRVCRARTDRAAHH